MNKAVKRSPKKTRKKMRLNGMRMKRSAKLTRVRRIKVRVKMKNQSSDPGNEGIEEESGDFSFVHIYTLRMSPQHRLAVIQTSRYILTRANNINTRQ